MRPARRTTRPRSRLIGPLLLVAGAAALVALAAATLTFAKDLETSASGLDDAALDDGVERALDELGRTEGKLERARDEVRELEAKLKRTSRLSARRGRQLGRIRGAAGGELPLTDDPCGLSLALAAARGLRLPDAYEIHCPGPGLDWNGGSHWGVTCPYVDCPEGHGPYVSISNPTYYVVAHELCHAVFGYGVGVEEALADSCAAEHGASLATSPYR